MFKKKITKKEKRKRQGRVYFVWDPQDRDINTTASYGTLNSFSLDYSPSFYFGYIKLSFLLFWEFFTSLHFYKSSFRSSPLERTGVVHRVANLHRIQHSLKSTSTKKISYIQRFLGFLFRLLYYQIIYGASKKIQ